MRAKLLLRDLLLLAIGFVAGAAATAGGWLRLNLPAMDNLPIPGARAVRYVHRHPYETLIIGALILVVFLQARHPGVKTKK